MNPRAIALVMLVACAYALLDGKSRNDSQTFDLVKFIADGVNTIKNNGLDPYVIEGDFYHIALNYPWLGKLDGTGYFHNFELIGLSDIIYDISYEELEFVIDIRFPRLESTIGEAVWQGSYKDSFYEIILGGRFAINDIFINVRVKPGSTELSEENYKFEVELGSIESKMVMIIGENDISENFNNFMETSIPYLLRVYKKELNEILSDLVLELPELLKR